MYVCETKTDKNLIKNNKMGVGRTTQIYVINKIYIKKNKKYVLKGFVWEEMNWRLQAASISVEDFCGKAFVASKANKWLSVLNEISGPLIKMTTPQRKCSFERSAGLEHFQKHGQIVLWFTRQDSGSMHFPMAAAIKLALCMLSQLAFAVFKPTNLAARQLVVSLWAYITPWQGHIKIL